MPPEMPLEKEFWIELQRRHSIARSQQQTPQAPPKKNVPLERLFLVEQKKRQFSSYSYDNLLISAGLLLELIKKYSELCQKINLKLPNNLFKQSELIKGAKIDNLSQNDLVNLVIAETILAEKMDEFIKKNT